MGLKREQVRERFNIEGDLWQDFAVSSDKLQSCCVCCSNRSADRNAQASMFCMSCTVAQMNTELKDRAAKVNLGKPIGYQPQTQGMVYLPPNQQPQVQEKKPTQQGV